ncbi:AMP-dependent synthetase (plasmid) [Rhizobium sp. ACO-34A]|nr:class I adenylate-forming enzyme family protein [Rhizobium sp. ACO-34A]ATN37629.1 AMP-dependent synthetase [Rhizobium sp. ACO-34A]
MRIEDHLRASARKLPEKVALMAGETQLTYSGLDEASDRLASVLFRSGVRPGDRVVLLLENGSEFVTSLFAIWKAGAVACPLHPSTRAEKLGRIVESLGASALVTQARLLPTAQAAVARRDGSTVLLAWGLAEEALNEAAARCEQLLAEGTDAPALNNDERALALILHTSGSTGEPKGVMHTHASLGAACASIIVYLGNDENDVVFNVLPLSFGYGLTQVVTMAMVGGTLHLEKSFAFPAAILKRLAETRATGLPLVPSMAAAIANMKELEPGFLPDIRYITSAAAALPPAIAGKIRRLFPAARLHIMYGQTECIRALSLPPEALGAHPASVGFAIPGTEAFVIDENGERAAPGTVGELLIRGPHVMTGYWNDPDASATKLREEAGGDSRILQTGDLFSADENGFLTFVSRRDDIIKSRGEKVSPQEVERALYAIEGIVEAAVTGVPDDFLGQAVKAFVVLAPGVSLSHRDIVRSLARTLEDYMLPQSTEFCESLPKTASGKLRLGLAQETIGD